MRLRILIIASVFVLGLQANASVCLDDVKSFLDSPTKQYFDALQQKNCASELVASNADLNRLNNLVRHGNRWSAEIAARNLRQLDGGNLEDTLIALGEFSEKDMERLLLFSKEGLLSRRDLSNALTMLPLSVSDQPDAQLTAVRARRKKVLAVSRKELSEQKVQAVKALDEFVAEIRAHK
jgi:hypothetical protein